MELDEAFETLKKSGYLVNEAVEKPIPFDIDSRGGKVYDGETYFYSKGDVDAYIKALENEIAYLKKENERLENELYEVQSEAESLKG